jgi:hypothetical protein
MSKRLEKSVPSTVVIQSRVTPGERRLMAHLARKRGVSMSEYLRTLVLEDSAAVKLGIHYPTRVAELEAEVARVKAERDRLVAAGVKVPRR